MTIIPQPNFNTQKNILPQSVGENLLQPGENFTPSPGLNIDSTLKVLVDANGNLNLKGATIEMKAGNTILYDAVVDAAGSGDYVDIQSALDAGANSIFVRNGTYLLIYPITIKASETTITGESRDGVILKVHDDAGASNRCMNIGDGASTYQDISVKNITFNGNLSETALGDCLSIKSKTSKVIISGCRFTNSREMLEISSTNTSYMTIRDNEFDEFTSAAIQGWAPFTSITNNYLHNAAQQGFGILTGNNMICSDNLISNLIVGILVRGNNSVVSNNIIKDSKTGIDVDSIMESSKYNVIDGNTIEDSGQHGITLASGAWNTVSNNTIKNSSQDANDTYSDIYLNHDPYEPSIYNTITGNVIRSAAANKSKYGIREEDADQDYNIIVGNIVQGAVTANISSQGTSSEVAHNIE